ncbi:MAG: hypothetical protein MJA84_02020 [Firmicutes bacterium]|nr:hypothetical protein [Bacillota bacterium]
MHEISWLVIILYSIPQCFLCIFLGFQLVNYKPPLITLFAIALAYSPFVYVVRRIDLPYGFHAMILTLIIVFLVRIALKLSIINCAIVVVIGSISALVLESLLLPLVINLLKINFTEVINSSFYSIALSSPQLLALIAINLFVYYKKIYLLNINKDV